VKFEDLSDPEYDAARAKSHPWVVETLSLGPNEEEWTIQHEFEQEDEARKLAAEMVVIDIGVGALGGPWVRARLRSGE
jgi:hypothetical protein